VRVATLSALRQQRMAIQWRIRLAKSFIIGIMYPRTMNELLYWLLIRLPGHSALAFRGNIKDAFHAT
jgi:hypothetical protein